MIFYCALKVNFSVITREASFPFKILVAGLFLGNTHMHTYIHTYVQSKF